MKTTNILMRDIQQLVSSLLKEQSYGVYELAQECAQQLHEPLYEIMTPFCDSLKVMVNCGELCYDRQHNLVLLQSNFSMEIVR